MSDATITRKQLQTAIEEGITAGGIGGDPAERLRRVGREATEVAIGSMTRGECGCPLVQAGLFRTDTEDDDLQVWQDITGQEGTAFYDAFDPSPAFQSLAHEARLNPVRVVR